MRQLDTGNMRKTNGTTTGCALTDVEVARINAEVGALMMEREEINEDRILLGMRVQFQMCSCFGLPSHVYKWSSCPGPSSRSAAPHPPHPTPPNQPHPTPPHPTQPTHPPSTNQPHPTPPRHTPHTPPRQIPPLSALRLYGPTPPTVPPHPHTTAASSAPAAAVAAIAAAAVVPVAGSSNSSSNSSSSSSIRNVHCPREFVRRQRQP
jgi:hypothetical protein